jgi:hypothetical protein
MAVSRKSETVNTKTKFIKVNMNPSYEVLAERVASLESTIAFACHLLALGITGYRSKKGTPEECLFDNVDRATKEYARIRK